MTFIEKLRAALDITSWIDWRRRCFEAAWKFQQVHPELKLHHGKFIYGPHAWCEDHEGHVYDLTCAECWRLDDKSPPIAMDRAYFFETFDAETEAIYSADEAMRFAAEYEHFGPWE